MRSPMIGNRMRVFAVAGSGKTKINGVAGPRQAVGTGTFSPAKGSGKWNGTGPSGVCSGVWVADRVTHTV